MRAFSSSSPTTMTLAMSTSSPARPAGALIARILAREASPQSLVLYLTKSGHRGSDTERVGDHRISLNRVHVRQEPDLDVADTSVMRSTDVDAVVEELNVVPASGPNRHLPLRPLPVRGHPLGMEALYGQLARHGFLVAVAGELARVISVRLPANFDR